MVVGIRGAITVEENTRPSIVNAAKLLLREILKTNNLAEEHLISVIFTVTPDLTNAFPAQAARELGLVNTPLMCATEIPVPHSLARCIRVLIHAQGELTKDNVTHIYLKGAEVLRPDLRRMSANERTLS